MLGKQKEIVIFFIKGTKEKTLIYVGKEKHKNPLFWLLGLTGKKTDKFYLHMQKGPVCKRHFSTWKYFGQNQLRRVEEIFNIKNKANTNNIKLVLCLNCYLLLQLSASQLFVSIFISTNFFFPQTAVVKILIFIADEQTKKQGTEVSCVLRVRL